MQAKGSGFLKVTGILMIIFGALAIILNIIAVAGIAALAAFGLSSGMLWVGGIIGLVSAVAQFVAGIVGVANSKKPEKAGACMAWGIIVAVLCVVSGIITVAAGGSFPVFSTLIGLVIPVLYIIGAAKNKQA